MASTQEPGRDNAAHNPFAPPGADVADVAPADGQPVLATRGIRLGAVLIDIVLQISAAMVLGMVLGKSLISNDTSLGHAVFVALLGAAVFLALQGVLLVRHGQTWGKRWLGLRIVRSDGSRASPGRVLGLRYGIGFLVSPVPVLGALFGLVDALLIFRGSRQCLHDTIADTIVIKL